MTIKERIANIAPYFKEMQIVPLKDGTQVVYVIVSFPHGWVIDDDIQKKFNVTVSDCEIIDQYYFCASIDDGTDIVFDAIEYNIGKMKEAIERGQILNTKIRDLKAIFENEDIPIESLRTLKIVYDTNVAEDTKIIMPIKKSKKDEQDKNNSAEIVKEVEKS